MAKHSQGSMDITSQEKTFNSFISWVTRTVIAIIVVVIWSWSSSRCFRPSTRWHGYVLRMVSRYFFSRRALSYVYIIKTGGSNLFDETNYTVCPGHTRVPRAQCAPCILRHLVQYWYLVPCVCVVTQLL